MLFLPYDARQRARLWHQWPWSLTAWWLLLAWSSITVYTALVAHQTSHKITAGILMAVASVLVQLTDSPRAWLRPTAVVVTMVAGLAAMLVAPNGIGEAAVIVAASRIPTAFRGRPQLVATVLGTITFAAAVGWITHSVAGLLSGIGIPLLVQRAVEHRELVAERDRAQALLAEVQAGREAESQAAALRERGRIARDLHDVLAHSLAGLSVQLQAARAVANRLQVGAAVLEPLDKAAALARDGLSDAREAVASLRDPVGLGLDELPALVERHPGVARLSASGTAVPISPEAGHAVYRAVQESLTNAARYAPGAPVGVALDWTAGQLTVRVDDSGLPIGHSAVAGSGTGLGTGMGLAGMDERVTHAGGRLHAGPQPNGGWRVEITVPTASGTAPVSAAVGAKPEQP